MVIAKGEKIFEIEHILAFIARARIIRPSRSVFE